MWVESQTGQLLVFLFGQFELQFSPTFVREADPFASGIEQELYLVLRERRVRDIHDHREVEPVDTRFLNVQFDGSRHLGLQERGEFAAEVEFERQWERLKPGNEAIRKLSCDLGGPALTGEVPPKTRGVESSGGFSKGRSVEHPERFWRLRGA